MIITNKKELIRKIGKYVALTGRRSKDKMYNQFVVLKLTKIEDRPKWMDYTELKNTLFGYRIYGEDMVFIKDGKVIEYCENETMSQFVYYAIDLTSKELNRQISYDTDLTKEKIKKCKNTLMKLKYNNYFK